MFTNERPVGEQDCKPSHFSISSLSQSKLLIDNYCVRLEPLSLPPLSLSPLLSPSPPHQPLSQFFALLTLLSKSQSWLFSLMAQLLPLPILLNVTHASLLWFSNHLRRKRKWCNQEVLISVQVVALYITVDCLELASKPTILLSNND